MKCKIDLCENKSKTKIGYCSKHYNCYKRTGSPFPKQIKRDPICSVNDCEKPHRRNGYCDLHSVRFWRHGDTDTHFFKIYESEEAKTAGVKKSKSKYESSAKGKFTLKIKRQRRRKATAEDIKLTLAQERFLLELFGNKCFNCSTIKDLTLDHHVPLNAGGMLNVHNVVILCRSCNGKKSDFLPEDWYTQDKLKILKTIKFKIDQKLSSLPILYLLSGTYGVGKTTLAKTFSNNAEVIHYDDFVRKTELYNKLDDLSDKHIKLPILFETPIRISSFMNEFSMKFQIKLVILNESEDVLKERLESRNGSISKSVLKRKKTLLNYAHRYDGFVGNYIECADFLKNKLINEK